MDDCLLVLEVRPAPIQPTIITPVIFLCKFWKHIFMIYHIYICLKAHHHPSLLQYISYDIDFEYLVWKMKKAYIQYEKKDFLQCEHWKSKSTVWKRQISHMKVPRQVIIDLVDISSSWTCLTGRCCNSFNGNQFSALHYYPARSTHIHSFLFYNLSVCKGFSFCWKWNGLVKHIVKSHKGSGWNRILISSKIIPISIFGGI